MDADTRLAIKMLKESVEALKDLANSSQPKTILRSQCNFIEGNLETVDQILLKNGA